MCGPIQVGAGGVAKAMRGRARRGGYSLVEILVALLVLGVLVSIMLPALHRTMRYSAPLVRCSNNLRQLHQALTMYLGSSNDLLPLSGYEPLRDLTYPSLNTTLGPFGVKAVKFWTCPADSRSAAITNRWGSTVYPPGRFMVTSRRRVRMDDFGPEYPVLADRGPFHLLIEKGLPPETPLRVLIDPATNRMQSGFYEGHNSVWTSGRITHRASGGGR